MGYRDRFIALYLTPLCNLRSLQLLETVAKQLQLADHLPEPERVGVLSDIGDSHPKTWDEVHQQLQRSSNLTVQWWWKECEDLCCQIRVESHAICLHFCLEGNSVEQFDHVHHRLTKVFCDLAKQGLAIALVVDQLGEVAEYLQSEMVFGSLPFASPFPDELLIADFKPLQWLDSGVVQIQPVNKWVIRVTPLPEHQQQRLQVRNSPEST